MKVYTQISNINEVKLVNLGLYLKHLTVKSTMFSHRNVHKNTWTSLDGKIHNKIEDVLIDM
jgi:hypothetical protein